MRAILTTGQGDLQVTDIATPQPGSDQVRIRVKAAAVNPVDLSTADGMFHRLGLLAPDTTVGIGWDVSGVVDAVGDGVDAFRPGDEVAGLLTGFDSDIGTYSEQVVLDADAVAHLPAGLDLVRAAAVPLIAQTANQAMGLLRPQVATLLITGASGGVGGYAVPLAARRGLTVTALGKADDAERLRESGAATVVASLDELTGQRFDAVVDAAVIGADLFELTVDAGHYIGFIPAAVPASERGIAVEAVTVHADGAELAELLAEVSAGHLPLRIAGDFPLEQARKAHASMAAKTSPGRWLVTVPATT
ncbi:NADP-dependent oxidoreductase [Williamsia soli]|uniref:NADP-dependent oxidoreductase n=1 Tax=Williamsia soli TaxID=364929 RepID=UPI001A9E0FFB|nr:NADP-dependent oxidoreductase [Williamsia soli]